MNELEIARSIWVLLGLALVAGWLYGPWQTFVVDLVRQQIFELRDHLFDIAADGNIGFDDPAYRHARDLLNALIRFAHHATIWRIALTARIARDLPEPDFPQSTAQGMKDVNWVIRRATVLMVAAMWLRSPFFVAVLAFLAPALLVISLLSEGAKKNGRLLYRNVNATVTREALAKETSVLQHRFAT